MLRVFVVVPSVVLVAHFLHSMLLLVRSIRSGCMLVPPAIGRKWNTTNRSPPRQPYHPAAHSAAAPQPQRRPVFHPPLLFSPHHPHAPALLSRLRPPSAPRSFFFCHSAIAPFSPPSEPHPRAPRPRAAIPP